MLLRELRRYAQEQMNLPPKLYKETAVRYVVSLDSKGNVLSPTPIDLSDPSIPRGRRGQIRPMPQVVRSSGIRPLLFADNSEYTLCLPREGAKQDRVSAAHSAYLELVSRCAESTGLSSVRAIESFLSGPGKGLLRFPEDFDAGATITFEVDGRRVTDDPAVQGFWASLHDSAGDKATRMQCLVCGEEKPVLDRLQGKIKGVPGGQTSGTSVISANSEAFESYGLEASLIAPTCADCGEQFTVALNFLLASRDHSRRLSNTAAFVWWTRQKIEINLLDGLFEPTDDFVGALIDDLHRPTSTQPGTVIQPNRFYGTTLSGSGARTVVRDWIDISVGEAVSSIARWFDLQRIVDPYGEPSRPLGIPALAGAMVRDLKDVPAPTFRLLLRCALERTPLPWNFLAAAVRRTHAEQNVTRNQAALIKLVLLSRDAQRHRKDYMTALEPEHPSPAYHCGRLLAVLEDIQRSAIPGANATVVDRFFGSASTAPAGVLPRLMRGAQPHLSKLERDRPGAFQALQRRMEEILDRIPGATGFPKVLSLEEQGLFSLGYYHQRAAERAERANRRSAGADDDQSNETSTSDEENE